MFDYLQQFNRLAKDLRDQVSSPSVMAVITELEKKYKADLAATVMKVMVKSVAIRELPSHLSLETGLAPEKASELASEMREKIFVRVADHLGLAGEERALDLDRDVDVIIKQAGLVLPSGVLVSRFKNILSTYLRGVRSKIDTRNTLQKDVKIGGLNLGPEEIERIFKICSTNKFSSFAIPTASSPDGAQKPKSQPVTPGAPQPSAPPSPSARSAEAGAGRLSQIMAGADQIGGYDLKKALAGGEVKIPTDRKPETPVRPISPVKPEAPTKPATDLKNKSPLDTGHEISAPAPQLDFPLPEKKLAVAPPANIPFVPESIKPASKEIPKPDMKPKDETASQIAPKATAQPSPPSQRKSPETAPKPVQPIPVSTSAKPAPAASTPPTPAPRPATSRPAPAPSPRPQMHDVRPMPKVMGPIEELQFLDLVNFRRLGTTPAESVNKVFAKIKLLEKDGYDKMVLGVKAWRQSPANRLYLRLGQEAVAKGKFLKDIVDERKKAGQEYLKDDEINAIVKLNSKLVF